MGKRIHNWSCRGYPIWGINPAKAYFAGSITDRFGGTANAEFGFKAKNHPKLGREYILPLDGRGRGFEMVTNKNLSISKPKSPEGPGPEAPPIPLPILVRVPWIPTEPVEPPIQPPPAGNEV